MFEYQNREYYDQVVEFSKKTGQYDKLCRRLDYLDNYACGEPGQEGYDRTKTKCVLGKDFAPASFNFTMLRKDANGDFQYWFNGGLIYHGPHDGFGSGSAPTFAVTVSPEDGWSIHT